ncbi:MULTISPECIES: hypothetical protein [Streptomyces]|uniref:hypothetical protein n=1 Tax=Streptomyces TaxID=1883 RepID=UPI002F92956D
MNATVTNTGGSGHLSIAPDPNTQQQYDKGTATTPHPPQSSNLNWTKGATVSNLAQTGTGPDGIVDFWNRSWEPVDVVVDLFGIYDRR